MPSDLSYAIFSSAMLIEARMDKVLLQGAKLDWANFQGASLRSANFQGAELFGAEFRGAGLNWAEFQGAELSKAQFQGAKLFGAQFQGAGLKAAQFQGAKLSGAEFHGADLIGAQFQGAKLDRAQFKGAELFRAQFQGADLEESNFTLASILGARFGFLTQEELSVVTAGVNKTIPDEALHQSFTDQLRANIRSQKYVFAATGDNIWDSNLRRTRLFGFWNGLKAASDFTDYQNKLAGYLIELSCEDRWVAQGIIRYRIGSALASSFAQCLLSLKDQNNQVGQLVCPAISKIDQETLKVLNRMATTGKNPDATITPTFACSAERFDPVPAAD